MTEPTDYQLNAAVRQARLLDQSGGASVDLDRAQRVTATEGRFPQEILKTGHRLLVDLGLVVLRGDRYEVSPQVSVLVGLEDEQAIEMLGRLARVARYELGKRPDAAAIGAAGEELVVSLLREDLDRTGHGHLTKQVQRVSLLDDSLGYDLVAPRLDGSQRWLEVKASTSVRPGPFRCFLTRNEYEVGLRNPSRWALVACAVDSTELERGGEVFGWCPAATLLPYLPDDAGGRWAEALVQIPRAVLVAGLPPSV